MGGLPNCYFCGRFVGWKKPYVTWICYGSVLDYEPPDPDYAHKSCWDKNEQDHALINRISWCKPQIMELKK